ncbi:hypothetical protein DaAHT2_2403 [Desulfurivibrio alkaliphilus AHT 2]|uniref:Uncharacterized protein n=1 Tax=Desulfurivibrio alkaliphilus (strain DSM 19089 / UNIQEM U267 / AHT2) TaxID=589865 RepID=D6Z035_DESAT|nr:hypothetical protein DaAHT2_2403 [Desulfurivibrio alkaliphilus AHT 2]
MTAKDLDGKLIANDTRHYHPQATTQRGANVMVYGAQWKASYVRDTSIQPFRTKEETFEFLLPEGTRCADVEVELRYELGNPNQIIPIHKRTKRVTLDRCPPL